MHREIPSFLAWRDHVLSTNDDILYVREETVPCLRDSCFGMEFGPGAMKLRKLMY
jgi:hypothetical protein